MNKTLLLAALVSASAFAQEATPASAEAPPPPPPPLEAAAPAPAADAPMRDPGGRVRWGIGAGAGMHFGTPYPVFGGQLKGRVGYQFTNLLGVYVDIGTDFGIGGQISLTPSQGGSASGTLISHFFIQALAELMLGDLFYVAGGGGLAHGSLAILGVDASTNSGGISAIVAGGFNPAFDVKLGFGFGKPKPGSWRRGGFNLGIDLQMVLHTNALVTRVQGGTGGASITVDTRETVFTATPMLTLGYDAR